MLGGEFPPAYWLILLLPVIGLVLLRFNKVIAGILIASPAMVLSFAYIEFSKLSRKPENPETLPTYITVIYILDFSKRTLLKARKWFGADQIISDDGATSASLKRTGTDL